MRKRILVVATVIGLAATLAAGFAAPALASSWTDLPNSVLATYGITNSQVGQISQGFGNGLWRPSQQITRAQFVKMACAALGIAKANPSVATFTDVKKGSTYYQYVEGAVASGAIKGITAARFAPSVYITREQGLAIIARVIATATSQDLNTLYTSGQISSWLAALPDGSAVSSSLRSAVVFAANVRIIGANTGDDLDPRGWLKRIDAAAFLIRGKAPTVASVSPSSGGSGGGNTVTITGTRFSDASSVQFGEVDAQNFTIVSDTQITAVVPEGTMGQTVNVVVTNPQGNSAVWKVTYTYSYSVPVITLLSPNNGSATGGYTVIITGSGFTGATAVQFGGVDAQSFAVISDSQISAITPQGAAATTVSVTVVGPEGTSDDSSEASSYTYNKPVITSVSPDHGPAAGGNTVTITGSGFAALTGSSAVGFNGINAWSYKIISDTQLTAVVPAGTKGDKVPVVVDGQDPSVEIWYTYDYPCIFSITPELGPVAGGNTIYINGVGFSDAMKVYFGSESEATTLPNPERFAKPFVVVSDTLVRVTVPSSPTVPWTAYSPVDISVQTFDGMWITLENAYHFWDD
jgi:hypothetical protein